MKTVIIGKTDVTLTLNKCKTYLRGKVEAVVDITNDDQRRELAELENAGFIVVIDDKEENTIQIEAPPPRIVKRQPTEQERVKMAEAETQKMRSRAVIATGDGVAEVKMKRHAVDDICDSERTKASVEALKKLEKEEDDGEIADDLVVNESQLDPSEQIGRKAVVSTGAAQQSVNMVNKIVGEAEVAKKRDPFIDRKENAEREKLLSNQDQSPKTAASSPIEEDYVPELSEDDLFIGTDNNVEPEDEDKDDPFIEV